MALHVSGENRVQVLFLLSRTPRRNPELGERRKGSLERTRPSPSLWSAVSGLPVASIFFFCHFPLSHSWMIRGSPPLQCFERIARELPPERHSAAARHPTTLHKEGYIQLYGMVGVFASRHPLCKVRSPRCSAHWTHASRAFFVDTLRQAETSIVATCRACDGHCPSGDCQFHLGTRPAINQPSVLAVGQFRLACHSLVTAHRPSIQPFPSFTRLPAIPPDGCPSPFTASPSIGPSTSPSTSPATVPSIDPSSHRSSHRSVRPSSQPASQPQIGAGDRPPDRASSGTHLLADQPHSGSSSGCG